MYRVFTPRGELVATFSSAKAADAMARYDWKAVGDALYWSIAPQPATLGMVEVGQPEAPAEPHRLLDEPLTRCSMFECPKHRWRPGA